MRKGMGSHESARMGKDEWLTPPSLLSKLGEFNLDPCAPIVRPWDTAKYHYTVKDDGLNMPWKGRVWCNPPYGKHASAWLCRLAAHGNGLALIFARTETKFFFEQVWNKASAVLFLKGRLYFHHVDGTQAPASAGAPSVLVAYGENEAVRLQHFDVAGKYICLGGK